MFKAFMTSKLSDDACPSGKNMNNSSSSLFLGIVHKRVLL